MIECVLITFTLILVIIIIKQTKIKQDLKDKIKENYNKIKKNDELILKLRKNQEEKDKIINKYFEEKEK